MDPSPSLSNNANAYLNYSICYSVMFSKNIFLNNYRYVYMEYFIKNGIYMCVMEICMGDIYNRNSIIYKMNMSITDKFKE